MPPLSNDGRMINSNSLIIVLLLGLLLGLSVVVF